MELFLLSLLNGVSFGFILFLLAAGLTIAFGLMGIINLAHGALFMVAGYVGWTIAVKLGLNYGLAILIGTAVTGLTGLALERGFLRHLYRQPFEQVLLTWGFVLILVNLSLWMWGPMAKVPFTAPFLDRSFSILGLTYPISRISVIIIGAAVAIGLWWLQEKTHIGAVVRAGMDDKETAMGLGINLEVVYAGVFFVGACVAGFSGVIGAQLIGVTTSSAIDVLLLALVVVIVGGTGSVQGALVGSILIGIADNFGKALFPELGMFFIYLVLIIVLILRPSGLITRG